ncbi:Krueppel target at 95D [Carabus blaptoides fortunei]
MSDKLNKTMAGAGALTPSKPVPMKFFATWEVDRTPSNCIPRLCSLTLSRLVVFRPLGSDLASISIAVKMQSSKRTLRSNELLLPTNGLLDTGLEMTFSLQYPHFLKRDGNRLHILLQRRKRYKNRTMLGYKTLAEGIIRMDQVLQKQMDMELELVADSGNKDKSNMQTVAKLTVLQLSSTPVDQEQKSNVLIERGVTEFSDEEDDPEFSSGEEAELSDSEPLRSKLPHARHNLKQRFVSLLRRFRVPDTEASRAALGATLGNTSDIQALFHELESLSCDEDSTGEQDTMSISSTPKPSLRPFFSSSRSLLDTGPNSGTLGTSQSTLIGDITQHNSYTGLLDPAERHTEDKEKNSGSDGNADLCLTDYEAQSDPQTGSPPREKEVERDRKSKLFRSSGTGSASKKKNSLCISSDPGISETTVVRKIFLEHIARLLPAEETYLPDTVVLLSGAEHQTSLLATRLMGQYRVLQPASAIEVKAVLSALLNKIHKYCNSSAKPPNPIKLVLVGGDFIVSSCLRHYVDLLSAKPPDWQGYMRFYVVPLGMNGIARYLSTLDSLYSNLFPSETEIKSDELITRMQRYVSSTTAPAVQMSIAEAMLTCHDESSQIFIPFVNEVRVGPTDSCMSLSVDLEESTSGPLLSSSPPAPPLTPPSSPNVQNRDLPWEPLELQLDYWQVPKTQSDSVKTDSSTKSKLDGKCTLKGVFRSLQVSRLPPLGHSPANFSLTMNYITKEKKQKIMRLGKKKEKERDSDGRSQTVEGVSRLICSVKTSHSAPMRVVIDGTDWNGVKFFQLSSTWQTHIKNFTVSLVGVPLATSELS